MGASNELPESEELDALYDRFLIRRQVQQVSAAGLPQMLSGAAEHNLAVSASFWDVYLVSFPACGLQCKQHRQSSLGICQVCVPVNLVRPHLAFAGHLAPVQGGKAQ